MKISDMTIVQLRKALIQRGLPSAGNKGDLEMRLIQDLVDCGENSETFEFETVSAEVCAMFAKLSEQLKAQFEETKTKLEQIKAQSEEIKFEIKSHVELQSEKIINELRNSFNDRLEGSDAKVASIDDKEAELEIKESNLRADTEKKLSQIDGKVMQLDDIKHYEKLLQVENKLENKFSNLNTLNDNCQPITPAVPVDPNVVIKESLLDYHGRLPTRARWTIRAFIAPRRRPLKRLRTGIKYNLPLLPKGGRRASYHHRRVEKRKYTLREQRQKQRRTERRGVMDDVREATWWKQKTRTTEIKWKKRAKRNWWSMIEVWKRKKKRNNGQGNCQRTLSIVSCFVCKHGSKVRNR